MKNKVLKFLILITINLIFIAIIILLNNNIWMLNKSRNTLKMYESKLEMSVELQEAYIGDIKYSIIFKDEENGIKKIIYPNGDEINANNKKNVSIDYRTPEFGNYDFKIIDGQGYTYTKTLELLTLYQN